LLRRQLGVSSFGINAFVADAGRQLIGAHDELSGGAGGHEELYLVFAGRATFTVGDQTVEASRGTLLLCTPQERRAATAEEDGTTVLVFGGTPGSAYGAGAWEYTAAAGPDYNAGRYPQAYATMSEGLGECADNAGLQYNLGCVAALAGEGDTAVSHLREALRLDGEAVRWWADGDSDLDPIREREDFPL
jgi:hypothetical protein